MSIRKEQYGERGVYTKTEEAYVIWPSAYPVYDPCFLMRIKNFKVENGGKRVEAFYKRRNL